MCKSQYSRVQKVFIDDYEEESIIIEEGPTKNGLFDSFYLAFSTHGDIVLSV